MKTFILGDRWSMQIVWKQFCIGYSFEWGTHLFLMFGFVFFIRRMG